MSMLPDHVIRAELSGAIHPYRPERVQPASYDVTLGDDLLLTKPGRDPLDPDMDQSGAVIPIPNPDDAVWYLAPGRFVLGHLEETLTLPSDIAARVEGKSSLARLGLIVHTTAGFIDPGFSGQITLEIANLNSRTIILRPGMRIAQISFERLESPCEVPYGHESVGSRYQGQMGVTPSRGVNTD